MSGKGDRYEPLPPITRLPAFLWRRLSRSARVGVITVSAVTLLIGGLSVPSILESKESSRAAEEKAAAERRARRERALKALVKPRAVRTRSVAGLEAAIARDARRRTGDRILRAECERSERTSATAENRARGTSVSLSCLAVTAEIPGRDGVASAGRLGHPYRALAHFGQGRVAFCRVFGVSGEGGLKRERPVTVPTACGG